MGYAKNGKFYDMPYYGKPPIELTDRIQTEEILNRIFYYDSPHQGGDCATYIISRTSPGKMEEGKTIEQDTIIHFQEGSRSDPEANPGVLEHELLEIVRHRLKCFQAGPFACEENKKALICIEAALNWMKKRIEDRKARGVFTKYQK